jgi:hypothetical protein
MSKIKFVVARYENDSYEGFLSETLKNYDHEFVWNDEASSIFEKYNIGVSRLVKKGLQSNDIVCFCHADVKILDKDFEEKVLYAFEKVPMLGVAGVIGFIINLFSKEEEPITNPINPTITPTTTN